MDAVDRLMLANKPARREIEGELKRAAAALGFKLVPVQLTGDQKMARDRDWMVSVGTVPHSQSDETGLVTLIPADDEREFVKGGKGFDPKSTVVWEARIVKSEFVYTPVIELSAPSSNLPSLKEMWYAQRRDLPDNLRQKLFELMGIEIRRVEFDSQSVTMPVPDWASADDYSVFSQTLPLADARIAAQVFLQQMIAAGLLDNVVLVDRAILASVDDYVMHAVGTAWPTDPQNEAIQALRELLVK